MEQIEEKALEKMIDELRLEQFIEEEGAPNANLETIGRLCQQTYDKIMLWAAPVRKSTDKHLTEGRLDAQQEVRNHIAFASVVQAEMHDRPIAKELICSADMFTFWHDPGSGKTKWVRMTQAAADQLRDQKLGPGYSGKRKDKPVMGKGAIPVYGCIDASGDIVCLVEIFADPGVPAVDPTVELYHMYPLQALNSFSNDAYNSYVFAAVVHIDYDEEAMLQQIWETIIIPKQTKRAHDLLRMRVVESARTVGLPTPSQSQSQSKSISRPGAPVSLANTSDRSIVAPSRRNASNNAARMELEIPALLSPSRRISSGNAAQMAARLGEEMPFMSPPRNVPDAGPADVAEIPPLSPLDAVSAVQTGKANTAAVEARAAAHFGMSPPASSTRLRKRIFSQMSDNLDMEAKFQVIMVVF